MTTDEVKNEIKKIFTERLDMDLSEMDVGDDAPLFGEAGWDIDSVDVIDIVLGMEQAFKVKIKQDEDIQVHFASLNALASHIQELAG